MPESRTSSRLHRFTVPAESTGQRLDRFLASQLAELSRSRVQALIEEDRVRANGIAPKASHRVATGESITIEIPPPPPPGVAPEPIPLEVLYEDEDLAVLNKPAGMIVHPGAGGAGAGTVVAALLARYGGPQGLSETGGPLRPGIVHRLDKGTSGAIVIARKGAAHQKLAADFRDRHVQKTYLALLHGALRGDSGSIRLPIARDLRRRSRMTSRRPEGRAARTDWRVLLRIGRFTLAEVDLHTGRTHQIRVHFSALGCPVVGDTLYGAPRQERADSQLLPPLGRNFLHAARLEFHHPRTSRLLAVRAPLPAELTSYLSTLAGALHYDSASIDAALRGYL